MKGTEFNRSDRDSDANKSAQSEHGYHIDRARVLDACENALDTWQPAMGQFFLARLLGMSVHYSGQQCIIDFNVEPFMLNPKGTLHGGISALVLDTSMGHLLSHLYGPASTLEMKVQYLKPITPGPAKAVASVIKPGRRICFMQSDFYTGDGELAAFATSTWTLLTKPP